VRPLDGDAAELLLELGRARGVIDVAVSEEDLLHRHAGFGDGRLDAVEVAAGVHHRAALAGLVPDQGAVLLERRDGDDRGLQGHVAALFREYACSRRPIAPMAGSPRARSLREVLGQAGWHGAHALRVPADIRLVPLPPCSPELNPNDAAD